MPVVIQVGAFAFYARRFVRALQAIGQIQPFRKPRQWLAVARSVAANIIRGAGVAIIADCAVFDGMRFARIRIFIAHGGIARISEFAAIPLFAQTFTGSAAIVDRAEEPVVANCAVRNRIGHTRV